ncbi:MAG: DUF2975 domain-containing protein [Lachnospiraceae bacterium]|nr:DUF2975 domain-containing protein [Lachnospiraceae bacterium]
MRSKLAIFTKSMIDVFFYFGIAVLVSVPWVIRMAGKQIPVFERYYWQMVVVFIVSGILALAIFYELRKMFNTVLKEDPFVMENVQSLKKMGFYSFLIAGVSVVRLLFAITPAVLVIILVFTIAGLFSLVLSQVFKQAVIYKEENDLTI